MRTLLDLFLTFAKIGSFTFGGGYAMISLIERTCVSKKEWITQDEMMKILVIAESTPGPVAINFATYIGAKKKGVPGALAATLGVVLPSFLIMLLISLLFDRFLEIKWIASAFRGIKVAVGILIADAAVKKKRKMDKDVFSLIILAVSFAAMMLIDVFALRVSTILLMLGAAAAGLTVHLIRRHRNEEASR